MYPRIEIVPYNSEWLDWYELIRSRLMTCLGELALQIDHIGSTSIPGLGSKNRIDIQVSVKEVSQLVQNSFDQALATGGFSKTEFGLDHRPPGDQSPDLDWLKFFLTGFYSNPSFHFNIHIRAVGRKNQQYALIFRDYLRHHPSAASAYQKLKETLAKYHSENIEAYVDIKDPVCDIIFCGAIDWYSRKNTQ